MPTTATKALATLALLAAAACAPPPADSKNPAPEPAPTPATDTTAPADTRPAEGADPAARTASVFVVHQVPDFEAYLKQFKGNAEARKLAGVTSVTLARVTGDPGRVALHFSAGSLESVQSFLESAEYERLVEEDQATNSSLLWIATDELNELPSEIPAGSVSLFKKFPLADVDCAVRGLVSAQRTLRSQGVLGYSLHRSTVKADVVILHVLAKDAASAKQAYGGEPLKSSLTACGASALETPVLAENVTGL